MIVAAEFATICMIENKSLFLDLIDYMDKSNDGDEVRIAMYQHKLAELLDKVGPLNKNRPAKDVPPARRKLEGTLSIENLERVGLIIHVDHSRGVMVFAPFIIEMFRHFDSARLRRLNSADYEAIRASFNRLYSVFISMQSLSADDLDFREQVDTLHKEIRSALSNMKACVSALQSRLSRLGEIVESMRYDDIDEVTSAREALGEINSIYLRNILPALEFLAENTDLKEGRAALQALAMIADHLMVNGHQRLASSIYYNIEAIRSYRYDIEVIRGSLMRYVQQNAAQRLAYDKIEQAWNILYGAVQQLHDGALKGNQLSSNDPVFDNWPTFNGVKFRRFDAKLEWPDRNHRLLLTEHLRTELPNVKMPPALPQLVKPNGPGISGRKREEDERLFSISRLVADWELYPCNDLHEELNHYLSSHLEPYGLNDLLVGVSCLKGTDGAVLVPRFEVGTLSTENERLRYYKVRLEIAHA
ncbi:TPA: hypothetical protein ACNH47_001642 [Pseudomonas aeruginosa]